MTNGRMKERTAYHEAGHTCWWFLKIGGQIDAVSIVADKGSQGRVWLTADHAPRENYGPDIQPGQESQIMAVLQTEFTLSGLASEAVLIGKRGMWNSREFGWARQWIEAAWTPLQVGSVFHDTWLRTIDYLADPIRWAGVEQLARLLLEEEEVSHDRAFAVVTDAVAVKTRELAAAQGCVRKGR